MALVVGLTGGIASGKSTVANFLKEKGITVIDADVEAKEAVHKGEPAYEQIVDYFGKEILQEDGNIDRAKLGNIIFHNVEDRKILNQIVHPQVRRRMNDKKNEAIEKGERIVVLDIPLLFESNLKSMVDEVLLVYVDEKTQLKRLMERNQLSEKDALARIHSQMPLNEKIQLADKIIDNNGSLEQTLKQLNDILKDWDDL